MGSGRRPGVRVDVCLLLLHRSGGWDDVDDWLVKILVVRRIGYLDRVML